MGKLSKDQIGFLRMMKAKSKEFDKEFKEVFPEIFKEDNFNIGDWVWVTDIKGREALVKFYGNVRTYGWGHHKEWVGEYVGLNPENMVNKILRLASFEEVEGMMMGEALERDFVEGATFHPLFQQGRLDPCQQVFDGVFRYHIKTDRMYDGNRNCIYDNGRWAEVTNIYTKKDAEAKFGIIIVCDEA